jgi:hypothetical protein
MQWQQDQQQLQLRAQLLEKQRLHLQQLMDGAHQDELQQQQQQQQGIKREQPSLLHPMREEGEAQQQQQYIQEQQQQQYIQEQQQQQYVKEQLQQLVTRQQQQQQKASAAVAATAGGGASHAQAFPVDPVAATSEAAAAAAVAVLNGVLGRLKRHHEATLGGEGSEVAPAGSALPGDLEVIGAKKKRCWGHKLGDGGSIVGFSAEGQQQQLQQQVEGSSWRGGSSAGCDAEGQQQEEQDSSHASDTELGRPIRRRRGGSVVEGWGDEGRGGGGGDSSSESGAELLLHLRAVPVKVREGGNGRGTVEFLPVHQNTLPMSPGVRPTQDLFVLLFQCY